MYDEAIIRRGGAGGTGCYRFQRGHRVKARKWECEKHSRLHGRAGTVTSVTRPDARSYRVMVAWDLPSGVEELAHPSAGLMPQRDDRGRPLRVVLP
jgi:hypothetical protein